MTPLVRLSLFYAVACGASWLVALALFLVGGGLHPATGALFGVAYMFGPLVAALVVQRAAREPLWRPLGVVLRLDRWLLVAWLAPVLLTALTIAVSLLFPDVSLALDGSGYLERLSGYLPPEQLEEVRRAMSDVSPGLLALMLVVQPLVAGITVNALAAFGEEIGWRGVVHRELMPRGFWLGALVSGVLWGLWHAPMILLGHNYPGHPLLGVVLMTAWTVLLSPAFHYVRAKSGSVVTAAVMHGSLNAFGGLALLLVRGGDVLVVGVTGAAGLLALVVVNALLFAVIGLRPRL